ncbi:MAG: 4'-phosphopantetheinyl transferase superfamily protein [Bacteroidales bacterium]
MPIIKEYISESTHWAVWEVVESESEMMDELTEFSLFSDQLSMIKAGNRRIEFLAVRLLLSRMVGRQCRIDYHEDGKPFVDSLGRSISISHTRSKFVSILISDEAICGIDIELNNSRIFNIRSRFVSPKEELFINEERQQEQLLLIWSAKESLYKAIPGSAIDFIDHLEIMPFDLSGKGRFEAREYYTKEQYRFSVEYINSSDYVLTIATRLGIDNGVCNN